MNFKCPIRRSCNLSDLEIAEMWNHQVVLKKTVLEQSQWMHKPCGMWCYIVGTIFWNCRPPKPQVLAAKHGIAMQHYIQNTLLSYHRLLKKSGPMIPTVETLHHSLLSSVVGFLMQCSWVVCRLISRIVLIKPLCSTLNCTHKSFWTVIQ